MTDIDILSRGRQTGQDTDTPLRGVRCPPVPTGMPTVGVDLFSSRGSGLLAVWTCMTAHRRQSELAGGITVAFGSTGAAPRAARGHRSDRPRTRESGGNEPIPVGVPPQQVVPCSQSCGVECAIVSLSPAEIAKPAPAEIVTVAPATAIGDKPQIVKPQIVDDAAEISEGATA
jgi:hypothetical protein